MDYSFDHVHIICKDFDKMTAYFERVFGAEEVYREDNFHGAPNAVMKLGSARFFLRGVRPEETLGVAAPDAIMGLDHFSLAVDDVHAAAAELKERGAEFIREPGASGMGGRTTAFIRGPEDIRIELSERSGDTYKA
ncbi:MAG: VOC family protein [Nitrospinaceae bacterium]|jgi:lactoylglutathione lyase|nr:VOC family protein [Nitrospinaceae bacterium]MBT3433524.1 VOC family protein [Nitrospinaceae bacterium]MBT3822319.1 VOC family protein [Nitrospinaceae bacterium]MBT4092826.1 VOC family protein [Nitrospinaceae bacterium]MBT4430384.1 VOC family protein [Nitrospinaceae bacterium]